MKQRAELESTKSKVYNISTSGMQRGKNPRNIYDKK